MENQEGDELLLSRAWWTSGDMAVGEHTESSEQLDAQGGRNSHVSRLHAIAKAERHGDRRDRRSSNAVHVRCDYPRSTTWFTEGRPNAGLCVQAITYVLVDSSAGLERARHCAAQAAGRLLRGARRG